MNASDKEIIVHVKTTAIRKGSSIALPPEVLEALGVEQGQEVELEVIGRAVVIRSPKEARRSREFLKDFALILTKRRTAYQELAKGPDR